MTDLLYVFQVLYSENEMYQHSLKKKNLMNLENSNVYKYVALKTVNYFENYIMSSYCQYKYLDTFSSL